MDAHDWNERYGSDGHSIWSSQPNGALLTEIAGMEPGRALDVGCGEGADAIWLALQGWHVTAVDISQVALDRAAASAHQVGVVVSWECSNILTRSPTFAGFDLVSVQYPALERTDEAISSIIASVAPGGTLLLVGHAPLDEDHAQAHGFDHAEHIQPADVKACLDETWLVEVDETRLRTNPPPEGSPFTHDTVLRAHRRATAI